MEKTPSQIENSKTATEKSPAPKLSRRKVFKIAGGAAASAVLLANISVPPVVAQDETENPPAREVILDKKETAELLGEFRSFLGQAYSEGGIQAMRNKGWLKDSALLARKEIGVASLAYVLFEEKRPYEPVYTRQKDGKSLTKLANFYTDYAGNDQMDLFVAETKSLLKDKDLEFEEERETIEFENASSPDGDFVSYNRQFVADIPSGRELVKDPDLNEYSSPDVRVILKNDGTMQLSEILAVFNPSHDNRLV